MKTSRILTLAVTCLVLSAAQAQSSDPAANPKMYAEIGYSTVKLQTRSDGDHWKASPSLVTGTFGYQFHPNIAVEGVLGFGAGKDEVKHNGETTDEQIKLGNLFGVFVRPSVSFGDSVEVFGRVGWAHTQLKSSTDGNDRDSSLAYGIGAQFKLSKTSYLQANWTSYYNKHDTKIEGIGLAYGLRF